MAVVAYLLDIEGLRDRTSEDFRAALVQQAKASGFEPSFIAAVMRLESNFKPDAVNPNGHAGGLIQFWDSLFPPVAAAAGRPSVSWQQMVRLPAIDQLPFVMAYYRGTPLPRLGSAAKPGDYYMATFMPAYIGKAPETVLGERGAEGFSGKVYAQNQGLDLDHDGKLRVGDVTRAIDRVVDDARTRPVLPVTAAPPSSAPIAEAGGIGMLFFCPYCSNRCAARFSVAKVVDT